MGSESQLEPVLKSIARVYKALKPVLDVKEKVDFVCDAVAMAQSTLETGELPANDKTIEEARVKARALARAMSSLARKDENYWLEKSPANMLQPATVALAIGWLQQKSREIADAQVLAEGQLPLVDGMRRVFENPGVKVLRYFVNGPTSLNELDDLALAVIVADLRSVVANARIVQPVLKNAVAVLTR